MLSLPAIKRILNSVKPHSFFLVVALIAGCFYLFIMPPLQAPDEQDHFKRAYHISTGQFFPQKKGLRLGGEMPVSFKKYMIPYRFAATNLKYTLNSTVLENSFNIQLNEQEKEFDDFPNTSLYSPVCYIPQSIAMLVARKLDLGPAFMYYAGRLFIFLVWIVCTYHLIKIIPLGRWLFTFLLLLPMDLFIANSFSADNVVIILSLSLITLTLKYALDQQKFTPQRLLALLLLVALLALAKVVYATLFLLFLVIPQVKFATKKQFVLYFFILLTGAMIPALWWSKIITPYFTNYQMYDHVYRDFCCLSPCADYEAQKNYILSHGTYFFGVIYHSLFDHPYTYLTGYIGSLGNNDIPVPKWISGISYITILIIAFAEKNPARLSYFQKTIVFLGAFLTFVILLLSQHLVWDCVGEGVVDVIQGRYLIPLLPLLFLCFTNVFPRFSFHPFILVFTIVIMNNYIAARLIFNRYFEESYVTMFGFSCDAEKISENGLLQSSDSLVKIAAGGTLTDSISHTGKTSLLLSKKEPYGFTYKFKNLYAGDLIEISAWEKGDSAQMIISGSGNNKTTFYYNHWDIKYKDNKGWQRMEYAFTIPENHPFTDTAGAVFYIWNPSQSNICIDDVKFSIKRFSPTPAISY